MQRTRQYLDHQYLDRRISVSKAFLGLFVLGVVGWSVMGGCQRTALRPDDRRSQYDRYDQARNQRAEPFLEDEFGRRTPNLAGRLIDRAD